MTAPEAPETGLELVRAAVRAMDRRGRLPAGHADGARAAIREAASRGRLPDHPAGLLGAWEELPDPVRRAMRSLVESHIEGVMDTYPRGRLWPGAVSALLTAARAAERGGRPGVRRRLRKWASRGWAGPFEARRRLRRRRLERRWSGGGGLDLETLLHGAGRGPDWLLGDYATAIGIDPRCRGFHHDPERNVVFGYLIGIDLVVGLDEVWCLEANLQTAFNADRRRVFPSEPAVEVLFDLARETGARRVEWHDMEWGETAPWLIDELRSTAADRGVEVEVLESWRVPRRDDLPEGMDPPGKRLTSPLRPPRDTLILRRNDFRVGSDYLIGNKEPFTRAVHAALDRAGDTRVRIPHMARDPAEVLTSTEEGLPNLVYKYPHQGKGKGVYFLRVDDPREATRLARELDRRLGEAPGLFQPFVCSRLLPGRRVYDVRTELLLTPLGARHVLSIRREATRGLPDSAPPGLLEGDGRYTSNIATGGRFAPVADDEARRVRQAAEAVGEALIQALTRTFRTTP